MKSIPRLACLLIAILVATSVYAFEVIWDRSGAQDSSHYGYDILPLGDQNDDGFADWAVFACGTILHPGTVGALVEFFHGGYPPSTTPYISQHFAPPFQPGDLYSAGVVGDVNGDGFTDWSFYTRGIQDPNGHYFSLYLGGPQADTLADAQLVLDGDGGFGSLGDFNGDGYSDFYRYQTPPLDYIEVFYGGVSLDTIPDCIIYSRYHGTLATWPYAVGDLNGDGYSDFVGSSLAPYNTFIFLGGEHPDTIAAYVWSDMGIWPRGIANDLNANRCDELIYTYIDRAEVHYGRSALSNVPDLRLSFPCWGGADVVASLGDINHDGYKDMALVEGNCASEDFGVLSVYLGQPALGTQPAATIVGGDWQNLISIMTATGLGDVDGDGTDDWAIGAYDDLWRIGWRGRCIVIKGDTTLVAGAEDPFILHPLSFSLSCYPNPFNATTTISFTLAKTGSVDLKVYDVTGRLVSRLAGEHMGPPLQAGTHNISFDGGDLPSGIYFVRLQSGTVSQTQKICLLR
jgi:hypothetical protein